VFWQYPNIPESLGGYAVSDTQGMCSLYVRLCFVADSVIDEINSELSDTNRVFVLSISADLPERMQWMRTFYDIATQAGGPGIFWDGVSVHPYDERYTPDSSFRPSLFEAAAETLRTIMRDEKEDDGEMWITEIGWRGETDLAQQLQARNLSEVFTTAIGTEILPKSRYDRMCWYSFLEWRGENIGFGLLDTFYAPKAGLYASGQTRDILVGKRLNGRVMTGDIGTDTLVRMYEFEDAGGKKTWVCWKNGGMGGGGVEADLPVRSDTVVADSVAYDEQQGAELWAAATDGWLNLELNERPVFVSENVNLTRPELVVDSLVIANQHPQVGSVMDVHAWVHNDGHATPGTVQLDLVCNDTAFTYGMSPGSIDSGDTYEYSFEVNPVPGWMHGWCLFSAVVNPGQTYVEKSGTDDNAGFVRRYVSYPPTGVVDVVVPPGGMTNVPLVLFKLSSASMELDTTAQTPCDSERLLQVYFGISDTTAEDADTTAWFKCVADTSWTFLHGQGRYRCYLQVKDSWSESAWSADSVDSVVVFDTTAPSGTVTINSGARFTDTTGVLLYSGMTDSVSPLNAMRAGSLRLANIVENSGFDSQDGGWFFSNGQYDNNLGMAELTVTSNQSSLVAESIPVGSISPYYYDSCRLAADLLMHVHNAPESGKVFFCYYYAKPSPIMKDTIWQTRASVRFGACPQLS
jgi:hypothetical protein